MDTCIHYKYLLTELLLPSYKILLKFCSSTEKTVIFIISVIRLFIIYRLYHVLNNTTDFYKKNILLMICLVYLIINIIYVIIIPFKTPDYDQVQMDQEAQIIALALQENKVDKSKLNNVQSEGVIES